MVKYRKNIVDAVKGEADCSGKTHSDLEIIAAFNALFINITDRSQKLSQDLYAETKLLTVIGQQSVCLKHYKKPETDNLSITCKEISDQHEREAIYYHIFKIFKACMDQLTGTTV